MAITPFGLKNGTGHVPELAVRLSQRTYQLAAANALRFKYVLKPFTISPENDGGAFNDLLSLLAARGNKSPPRSEEVAWRPKLSPLEWIHPRPIKN